ncbi:pleiotropic drug resistance protein, ABC superfamily [Tothia fuscella]|uniref:Pleiotropic drug resistance protein, ABC superfamily n=1 Tax=Tothia fuscella TaxID=1048955 RepID=A0A9P4NRG5_9PEZI|nr:pleiotropic drug resistance protein, ABC superfamily [Tothia fuscella]
MSEANGEPSTRNYDPVQPIHSRRGSSPSESKTEVETIGCAESERFGSSFDDKRYAPIDPADREHLTRLATQLSRRPEPSDGLRSIRTIDIPSDDPALDPQHKSFDLYKWLKVFLHNLDEDGLGSENAGIVFKNLNISGKDAALQLQGTLGSLLMTPLRMGEIFRSGIQQPKPILRNFNGVLKSGELLVVLGRPGSGCTTFLKSLWGELHGLNVGESTVIHYNGIPQKQMIKEFKGEMTDKHFPFLTTSQTLKFAAAARTPSRRIAGTTREEFAGHVAQVVMAAFGLTHTANTRVGNDFVRGVSGGERKRVSIAEMTLAHSPLAAWDNSTRGLDSATALKFVQSLRLSADLSRSSHAVAIYQASQAIYDVFDKAIVLYEGREIYFGPADQAKAFFEEQGWYCPPRQTTGDFLTAVTNPLERKARDGMEDKVPRTPDDFEAYWQNSQAARSNEIEIAQHEKDFPLGGRVVEELRQQKNEAQASHTRPKSPYLISVPMQIKLCTKRAYQRIWNDKASTLATVAGQVTMALVSGSVYYGNPTATAGFFATGAIIFFAVLLAGLSAISEINSLYAQREIVEKHKSYAFYHPSTEAIAGVISDIPIKLLLAVVFNVILYFMANLRREPSQFFIFLLVNFVVMLVMSAVFRTMAAITKTVSQAMSLAGVLILVLIVFEFPGQEHMLSFLPPCTSDLRLKVYTGFVLPTAFMHSWFKWIHYLNPIYYAFELLIANEFHGRDFTCSAIVPAYTPPQGNSWICPVAGAIAGQDTVSGDAFIAASYKYYYSHVWRNFGFLIAFLIGFMCIYFVATELNSSTTSTAEVLVFRRGHVPSHLKGDLKSGSKDEEMGANEKTVNGDEGDTVNAIPPQKDLFTWRNVVYDIKVKGGERRLLDHVSGWVKPGTLTALMGVSGAGKTTLLDVLAARTTMGVITGDMLVNGLPRDESFQRKTGYCQQTDLHLSTSTVRESLRFSAVLRQPNSVSLRDKYAYVEDVIKMLNMADFAEAIVGVPGEGLNVEQRKLLTIGVELAAKPKLLLFLDEPTSGLDSQSAWGICAFLRKLADAGQAVLCTIHQPSAILFQEFDRLLFLAKGGKTVYFGPIGKNSCTLLDYFESHGAPKCGDDDNPAEYMLDIVNKGSSGQGQDWHEVWERSEEARAVLRELDELHEQKLQNNEAGEKEEAGAHSEFAMPFTTQLWVVTRRIFQQYWRMPEYILAKWMLGIVAGLFIGFSFFNSNSSQQGMQNVLFSVFMITAIFSSLVQQIMPLFVVQRSLYEVRERPSKAYSWKAFLIANIVVEIPYQIITGVLVFASYYYAVVGIQSSARQVTVLLFLIQFFIYASSFAHLIIAALPNAETAGAVVTLLFSMILTFNGVMQYPNALPGFWIFMYRVSPFTYWVAGMVSTQLHDRKVICSSTETSVFSPPSGQTCGEYLAPYIAAAEGSLSNPNATTDCQYCAVNTADQVLLRSNIFYAERWQNWGIVWAYVLFNIAGATLLYYVFRVKKWNVSALKEKFSRPKFKAAKIETVAKTLSKTLNKPPAVSPPFG